MTQWFHSATLVKARGNEGRFVARYVPDLPFMMPEGIEASFVPPVLDAPRKAKVRRCEPLDARTYLVDFDGIGDRSVAEMLAGCRCLVPRSEIQDMLPMDQGSLEGYTLCDGDDVVVGTVAELIRNPGQTLLEVERPQGQKPLLVPLVEDFIVEIDDSKGVLKMDLPSGLLDL